MFLFTTQLKAFFMMVTIYLDKMTLWYPLALLMKWQLGCDVLPTSCIEIPVASE